MEAKNFNLSEPGVLEAFCDDDAMRVWQRLRNSSEPMPATAVASGVRIDIGLAYRALDLLEGAQMVRKLTARGSRRAISDEVTLLTLIVLIPDDWRQDQPSVKLASAFMRRDQELLERAKRFLNSTRNEWFYAQVTSLVATKEEFEELQRRVEDVSRSVMQLAERTHPPENQTEVAARHAVQLRNAPLEGDTAPIAEISVGTRRGLELAQGDRTPLPNTLGAREVEIAKLF
jgi:hypothetical protein